MHKSSYLSSSRDCERIFFKLQDEEEEDEEEEEEEDNLEIDSQNK